MSTLKQGVFVLGLLFFFLIISTPSVLSKEKPPKCNINLVSTPQDIEIFPSVNATDIQIGFTIDPEPWEVQVVANAGATEVRFQPYWGNLGDTSQNPTFYQAYENVLQKLYDLCQKNQCLEPLLVAAYGPDTDPTKVQHATVSAAGAAKGSCTIPFESAKPITITPGYDYVVNETKGASSRQIVDTGYYAPSGAPLLSATNNSLILAAPLSQALQPGPRSPINLAINHRYFPLPDPSAPQPDAAANAYAQYVSYLYQQLMKPSRPISKARIEIWNEPPFVADKWDGGMSCFYSTSGACGKAPFACMSPNFYFVDALNATSGVFPGVPLVWGGTEKSGLNSLVTPRASKYIKKGISLPGNFGYESYHPYGPTPEWAAWRSNCVSSTGGPVKWCMVDPTSQASLWDMVYSEDVARQTKGINLNPVITEIGYPYHEATDPLEIKKARYIMRALLTYSSLGIKRINFYRLIDSMKKNGKFIDHYGFLRKLPGKPIVPLQPYEAVRSFMKNIIKPLGPIVTTDPQYTPKVVPPYQGKWPLTLVPILGTKGPITSHNTIYLTLWQRTWLRCGITCWRDITVLPTSVTLTIPNNYSVQGAQNLVMPGKKVNYSYTTTTVTVPVGDNPIAIEFDPVSGK